MKRLARLLAPRPLTLVAWLILLAGLIWGVAYLHLPIPYQVPWDGSPHIISTHQIGFGPAINLHQLADGTTLWDIHWPALLLNLLASYLLAAAISTALYANRISPRPGRTYACVAGIMLLAGIAVAFRHPPELWLSLFHPDKMSAMAMTGVPGRSIVDGTITTLDFEEVIPVKAVRFSGREYRLEPNPDVTDLSRVIASHRFYPATGYGQGGGLLRKLYTLNKLPLNVSHRLPAGAELAISRSLPHWRLDEDPKVEDPRFENGSGFLLVGTATKHKFLILGLSGPWMKPHEHIYYEVAYRWQEEDGIFSYVAKNSVHSHRYTHKPLPAIWLLRLQFIGLTVGGGLLLFAMLAGVAMVIPPWWTSPKPPSTSPR